MEQIFYRNINIKNMKCKNYHVCPPLKFQGTNNDYNVLFLNDKNHLI